MSLGGEGISLLLLPGWLALPSPGHTSQMPGHWQGRGREGDTQPGPWEGFPISSSEGLSGQQGAGVGGKGHGEVKRAPGTSWPRSSLTPRVERATD